MKLPSLRYLHQPTQRRKFHEMEAGFEMQGTLDEWLSK